MDNEPLTTPQTPEPQSPPTTVDSEITVPSLSAENQTPMDKYRYDDSETVNAGKLLNSALFAFGVGFLTIGAILLPIGAVVIITTLGTTTRTWWTDAEPIVTTIAGLIGIGVGIMIFMKRISQK